MKRLLIVEDEAAFAAILSRRMAKQGFETRTAQTSTDALLCARQWHPTHLLLDMKLASENGLELLKPLRQSLPDARIVLLTGFASIATAVEAIKLGADHYLAKPADTHTLLKALTEEGPLEEDLEEERVMSPDRLEWEHIQQALNAHDGNVSATARALGMHRRTLQRKLQKKPAHR
ncbi:response regulator transcription factor [Ferrimonas sediminicola]|uniref:Response regulator transcription factor n=1 Tax=Ferrimonas sediminicola TaxID=2569538 RepID=A0A4U1BBH5_9GAMM|nr:response regulator transcription factor [Ferrimonas sediminicola]TKB48131.1 response regulator transcription factor [Ferrimonas sediminicola]